uniref:Uncharacterized protein n=1 Tax=Oryza nivara TaxID=4536 RepID=A0A0E0J2K6_ORYNI
MSHESSGLHPRERPGVSGSTGSMRIFSPPPSGAVAAGLGRRERVATAAAAMAIVAATTTTTTAAATTTMMMTSAQELHAVAAASESATRSTALAMVAPECRPKNVPTGMRASRLQDPVALVSIGGWSPNQGVPQPAIILNPSFSRHRRGLCPGRPYWAAAMGLSNHTLSTLTGSRQVEPRGKSMGISIDSEPTAIDLFKELHCSKTKGFSEPVKKAIEDMHAREVLTSPSVEDGHQAKTSIEAVS